MVNPQRASLPLAVVCALLFGCAEAPETPPGDSVRPAKLIELRSAPLEVEVSVPAVVEASSSIDLTFPVGGLLDVIEVTEGDSVTQGTVVARLDQRDFRNELNRAQAEFDQAEKAFARAEQLIDSGAISRSDFDKLSTQVQVASASLDIARKRLDDSVLRAPFNGIVARVPAEAHQNVAAQAPIVTVQSTGRSEAVAQVPATLAARSGDLEPLATTMSLDAAPEVLVPATVLAFSAKADPATQTFEVRFLFEPPANITVLPGMTGEINVRLRVAQLETGAPESVSVPLDAVLSDGGEQYVWVVDEASMTVARRPIKVGGGIDTLSVIDGLEPGEVIVGAGAAYLHEGMRVRRFE